MAYYTSTAKTHLSNGLGSKTRIVSATIGGGISEAALKELLELMSAGGTAGTDDAVTIAGVGTATGAAFDAGTTTVVYLAVQGSGTLTPGSSYRGTSFTTALVCDFDDHLAP